MIGTGKAATFFLLGLVAFGLFMAILNGGGGIANTYLTANVTENSTVFLVVSTEGFLDTDYVFIRDEQISHSSKNATAFLGCTRGIGGTIPSEHVAGAAVYTGEVSSINQALGFNIGQMVSSVGVLSIIVIPFSFLTVTIPRMIAESASFFSGSIGLAILGTMWLCLIAGFIIALSITLVTAISQMASFVLGAFRRV